MVVDLKIVTKISRDQTKYKKAVMVWSILIVILCVALVLAHRWYNNMNKQLKQITDNKDLLR